MGMLVCCRRANVSSEVDIDLFTSQISSDRGKASALGGSVSYSPVKAYYEANIPLMSSEVQLLFKAYFTKRTLLRVDYIMKPLQQEAAQHLAVILDRLMDVESVSLVGNHLDVVGMEVLLPSIQQLPKLVRLKITQNELQDSGTTVLANGIGKMRCLQELVLEENCITDKGAAAIAKSLPECEALEYLDLRRNMITMAGYEELLRTASQTPHLSTLKLSNNRFTLPTSSPSRLKVL